MVSDPSGRTYSTPFLHLRLRNHCRRGIRKIVRVKRTEHLLWNCLFYNCQKSYTYKALPIWRPEEDLNNNDPNGRASVEGEELYSWECWVGEVVFIREEILPAPVDYLIPNILIWDWQHTAWEGFSYIFRNMYVCICKSDLSRRGYELEKEKGRHMGGTGGKKGNRGNDAIIISENKTL